MSEKYLILSKAQIVTALCEQVTINRNLVLGSKASLSKRELVRLELMNQGYKSACEYAILLMLNGELAN